MKGNGNSIIVAISACILSILIGYLATSFVKLLFTPSKAVGTVSSKSGGKVSDAVVVDATLGTVTSSDNHTSLAAPVILKVDCVYHSASERYLVYATVNGAGEKSLSFRLVSQNGASNNYEGERDSSGRWVIRGIRPSVTPYSLIAVNVETGMESEPFLVNGCLPQRKRISASELEEALNHWDARDQNLIDTGVAQSLSIVVVGDDDNKGFTNLLQIANTIRGNNWKSVSVSNVRYDESNKIIGFTLTVVKTDQ